MVIVDERRIDIRIISTFHYSMTDQVYLTVKEFLS